MKSTNRDCYSWPVCIAIVLGGIVLFTIAVGILAELIDEPRQTYVPSPSKASPLTQRQQEERRWQKELAEAARDHKEFKKWDSGPHLYPRLPKHSHSTSEAN